MVCKIEWDQEFLCENFTKTFVNKELKVHRENYLYEKQMALLPETQEYAEQLKLAKILDKERVELHKKRKVIENTLRKINTEIKEIDLTIRDIYNTNGEGIVNKVKFTYKCPVNNCNGFLNEKYECGICDNKICKDCMEIKNEGHECDEEKKQTVTFLKKDTKPCPKCGELIHKLPNGCDQMYCIKCHTAFSWNNGTIERGTIHNPEYYRWMRENGQVLARNPLDIVHDACGNNLITYVPLLRLLKIYFTRTEDSQIIKISNMHRMINHIDFTVRNFTYENVQLNLTLRNMRANYILNNIKKEELKRKLQLFDKKNNKNKKMLDIWNLLRIVLIEYIGKIATLRVTKEDGIFEINKIIEESEKIRLYCNNSLKKVGKMYTVVYPGITKEWVHINNWETYTKKNP
jgi:hypothetical protein